MKTEATLDQASEWMPTRTAALERLARFLPHAGRDYANLRNYDYGPDRRTNVSGLSPFIRHRLLTEGEVVEATLGRHSLRSAEKFVGETCWRTYWKGWLELRPGVWSSYQNDLKRRMDELDRSSSLRERWEAATSGRSGVECVDLWVEELVTTGYLHNHARMWFASLWIFTLELPWELGADFFMRYLLDGDPASNTLSWRWVGGLQTRGKTYAASAGNIARFTEGRIQPGERFAQDVEPLDGPLAPAWRPLPSLEKLDPALPFALLLTEEDLGVESLDLGARVPVALAAVSTVEGRSPMEVGRLPRAFTQGAIDDTLVRAQGLWGVEGRVCEATVESVKAWAMEAGVGQVVTPQAPVGPAQRFLDRLSGNLAQAGIRMVRIRRDWDEELWPHATGGYFGFKKELETSLARLGFALGRK